MKLWRQTLLGAALVALTGAAQAELWAVKAAGMVDVAEGRWRADPLVVIDGERIKSVQFGRELSPPTGARLVELKGMTLLPGLMDMHVHITGDAHIHGYRRLALSLPRWAIKGVANARTTLMAGFTTIRVLGAPGYADVALRDAVNEGEVPGPRMFVAGPALGMTGGHCDSNLLPAEYDETAAGVADGPWAVREKVRENIKYGVDVIKFCATGGVLSKGTEVGAQQYTAEEMQALVDEAHQLGATVAAHAHGTSGIKAAIEAGVDSVEHASFLDDEAIALAKKHGTWLSMDIYNTEYILSEGEKAGILEESLAKERVVGGRQRESFTKAVKAGVKMVFGSDAAVYPHGDNGKQFSRMVQFGMTPIQAIQAATINAATLLKQPELGVIREGAYADLIAVTGNPLEQISLLESVPVVIKGGELVKDQR